MPKVTREKQTGESIISKSIFQLDDQLDDKLVSAENWKTLMADEHVAGITIVHLF